MAKRRRDDVKYRLEVLRELWSKILDEWEAAGSLERDEVRAMLAGAYERAGLQPIRGASRPPDLLDKELASLYVVGKHMGLDQQYPELFDRVFYREVRYEEAIRVLLSDPPELAATKVKMLLGEVSDNEIARMLRLKLTEVYFGFADESELYDLLKAVARAFPEKERIAAKYARFYTALMIARGISRGEVRSRLFKEAVKQATAIKLGGMHGVLPDDEYIATIAREVYDVPERVLRNVLRLEGGRRREREKAQQTGAGGVETRS